MCAVQRCQIECICMADRLYLSLWYPNFRLETLPSALAGVMRQFAVVGGKRVSAASAYPINFTEAATYQRIYVDAGPDPVTSPPELNPSADIANEGIEAAVAEATEQLHDDMAYEFEMRWQLWALADPSSGFSRGRQAAHDPDEDDPNFDEPGPDNPGTPWKLRAHAVRILGFGPTFDVAGYEQNGHILVDFGLDSPWLLESAAASDEEDDDDPDRLEEQRIEAHLHIQQNIEKLLAFTLLVEKHCGISSRLLWTESGEPLAEKLIARLQRVN
jgi:hypothetical protein